MNTVWSLLIRGKLRGEMFFDFPCLGLTFFPVSFGLDPSLACMLSGLSTSLLVMFPSLSVAWIIDSKIQYLLIQVTYMYCRRCIEMHEEFRTHGLTRTNVTAMSEGTRLKNTSSLLRTFFVWKRDSYPTIGIDILKVACYFQAHVGW